MRIGIVCGSFKPFTKGHQRLIEIVSKENEQVIVFVSLKDRKNKQDEAKIYGEDMKIIWQNYIIPCLPRNAEVIYSESPVRSVYSFLGNMNESDSPYIYKVYGDPDNIMENFPTVSREKYFGNLYKSGRLKFIPIPREQTEEISGTKMRQFLLNGMKSEFIYHLPDGPENEKEKMWSLLYGRFLRNKNPNSRDITKDFLYGILHTDDH